MQRGQGDCGLRCGLGDGRVARVTVEIPTREIEHDDGPVALSQGTSDARADASGSAGHHHRTVWSHDAPTSWR